MSKSAPPETGAASTRLADDRPWTSGRRPCFPDREHGGLSVTTCALRPKHTGSPQASTAADVSHHGVITNMCNIFHLPGNQEVHRLESPLSVMWQKRWKSPRDPIFPLSKKDFLLRVPHREEELSETVANSPVSTFCPLIPTVSICDAIACKN